MNLFPEKIRMGMAITIFSQLPQTDDNGVSGENFYWQDYLGDDYARIPIKFARKYFAESGGNPDELKLLLTTIIWNPTGIRIRS